MAGILRPQNDLIITLIFGLTSDQLTSILKLGVMTKKVSSIVHHWRIQANRLMEWLVVIEKAIFEWSFA